MDMRMMDEGYTAEIEQLQTLYDQDRFSDAWHQGCEWFGATTWPSPSLRLLAARILLHLGNMRKADAIMLRLWRQHPGLPKLAHFIASTINRRRGPLAALRLLPQLEQEAQANDHDLADLRVAKAEILMCFRDFSAAEDCLKDPHDQGKKWLQLAKAEIKYAQDDYAQALAQVENILAADGRYRPGIQFKASILQLQNDLSGAIELLDDFWQTSQSFWVGRQLCGLYIENKQYPQAYQALERLDKIPLPDQKDSLRMLHALRADLLCAEQRYEEALEFIEQKNFYGKSVVDAIKRAPDSSRRKLLDLPFVRQHHMTCAPASLTSIANYWGVNISQSEVVDAICYGGTQAVDERKWAQANNWFVQEFELTFAALKTLIDHDIPVLLSTVEPGSAHLQIIVGYDEVMGTYLLRDPYYRRLQEMLIEGCHKHYAASGPRCMVVAPMDYAERIAAMNLPCRELYDQLYKVYLALDNNQRGDAQEALTQAHALDPKHRITISCARALAFYDSDEPRGLEHTEQLLALFPEDVNLQLSKVGSLAAFSSATITRDYLDTIAKQPNSHFLIRSRLADNLRWDQREQVQVTALFQQLLNENPLHTASLYAYAGFLWDQENYRESFQLYRFATCLDDKNEHYAESFFKAARYHKQTEQGLTFLRDRFARFGKKSSGPAISLYNALDSLERAPEGLKMLDEAIALRPEDGWLMLFAARKFLYLQRAAHAQTLLANAQPFVNAVRYFELAAEIHEFNQETDLAVECIEQVLTLEPLSYKANSTKMRLLVEAGQRTEAQVFIAKQLTQFPGNAMLLRLQIEWLDETDHQAHARSYQAFIEQHPTDAWAHRGLGMALLALARPQEALQHIQAAIAIEPTASVNHARLGDIYLYQQERSLARASLRKAIELNCDYTYAYGKLMECGLNHEAQQQDLAFIYAQLMAQVSYGDGILEYQKIAWQLLSASEIIHFLQHALDARPDLWQSWVALALAKRNQGENEAALTLLDAAAERFPLLPRIFLERAETQQVMNLNSAAEESYRQALALAPGWTLAANNLCELLERQHRPEEAIALQRSMIARNPLASSPYGYLADLLMRNQQTPAAIEALEQAVARDPHYYWAWRLLSKLLAEADRTDEFQQKIHQVRAHFPDNADLVLVQVNALSEPEQAIQILDDFLALHPHNAEICEDYITRLAEQKHLERALNFASEHYWNGHRPNNILAIEAWVYAQQGDLRGAVAHMEKVATINPNFYEAWRLLTRWYVELKDKDNSLRAIDQCQRLYPNDPVVLCYVAEKLEAIDGDKERIGMLLRRAFELNPINQYNGLTYIDYALEQRDYEQASQALNLLHKHKRDTYTRYRELRLALAQEQTAAALEVYLEILQDHDASEWFVINGWEQLEEAKMAATAAERVNQLRATQAWLSPYVGRCLASYEFGQQKPASFEQSLMRKTLDDDFGHRYLEGYVRSLISLKRELPWNLLERFNAQLSQDIENWGLVGYLKVILGQWNGATNWLERQYPRPDAKAWMLYFYSIALRETGHWELAKQVTAEAFTKEPDNYREDILVWHSLDCLLDNKTVSFNELEYMDSDNLAGLSQYPLAVVNYLRALDGRTFIEGFADTTATLAACRAQWQEHHDSVACLYAKKRTRTHLSHTIDQPWLKKLQWTWRLAQSF